MKIRKSMLILTLMTAVGLPCTLGAGEPTIADRINSSGSVTIIQPDALNARLQKVVVSESDGDDNTEEQSGPVAIPKVKAGYRVQVFDDNNVRTAKQEAHERKTKIESRFPMMATYVTFNSPYWRVKVGDFSTRSEAEAAMAEIRQAFPELAKSLRIVRDRIKHQ